MANQGSTHQQSNYTEKQRNTATIAEFRTRLGDQSSLKILSYGCSIGDEIEDILTYFHQATIYGCDISEEAVRIASERHKHCSRVNIFLSSPAAITKHGPYDAIMAMNVLVRWPDTFGMQNIAAVYPFSEFEETISNMARSLTQDGLMAIYNSSYFFDHTSVRDQFEACLQAKPTENGWVEKYSKDGKLAAIPVNTKGQRLEKKNWRLYKMNNSAAANYQPMRYVAAQDLPFDTRTIIWKKKQRSDKEQSRPIQKDSILGRLLARFGSRVAQ
jgi:hypothetical protein